MESWQAVVVVPMYNEAAVVGDVVAGLREHFSHVVCVDDGSRDGSAAAARAAGGIVLTHRVNLGQGAALQTGFDYVLSRTSATHAVTFDADGQYRIEDALAMLSVATETGVDILLGSRNLGRTEGQPIARRVLMAAALRYSRRTTGLALTDTHNGLRVLNRRALAAMDLRHRGMAHASEIESRIGAASLTWQEHPVTMLYSDYSRSKGQSNLNAFNIVYDLTAARMRASA
ncbi:glycosyltransferase family 2 protein [Nocardioides sp. CER19]|uniref:glycosyltransferase family 2 protein n=1 Tax=Nocardioides sp. CER19 TaxID=3038538 RepID=UPI00244D7961|nr:glycosyltransferase family 2 protein [Nocardioides sp. CER19]MDH2416767.1 glycosyltransferase family 2 protein [Nocardioides sp. CER19]